MPLFLMSGAASGADMNFTIAVAASGCFPPVGYDFVGELIPCNGNGASPDFACLILLLDTPQIRVVA